MAIKLDSKPPENHHKLQKNQTKNPRKSDLKNPKKSDKKDYQKTPENQT